MHGRLNLIGHAAWLMALSVGCTGTPEERPPLEDCFVGAFFAECGGEGPPRLACLDDISVHLGVPEHSCLWFSGGQLAAGYTASRCPAEDICCEGDWPFPVTGSVQPDAVHSSLNYWGIEAWDRVRATNVEVRVDGGIVAPTEPSLSCVGGEVPELGPCDTDVGVFTTGVDSEILFFHSTAPSFESESLVLEVLDESGVLIARACLGRSQDYAVFGCNTLNEPRCATGGTLTINQTPSAGDLYGRFELTFADGLRIDGEF